MSKQTEQVEGLNIQLHGIDVGVVAHYAGGKNILSFNPEYIAMPEHERPVLILRTGLSSIKVSNLLVFLCSMTWCSPHLTYNMTALL